MRIRIRLSNFYQFKFCHQCCGSADPTRIQHFISKRIRIRIQGAKPTRIRILVRLKKSQEVDFNMKNIVKVGNMSKNIPTNYEGTKAFLKGRILGFFGNLCQFQCSWVLIHIPNTDPDPGQPNHFGSRIRIHNTACFYTFFVPN
jgi:hypothetical protein